MMIPESFKEIGRLSTAYRNQTEDALARFERESIEGPHALYTALSRLSDAELKQLIGWIWFGRDRFHNPEKQLDEYIGQAWVEDICQPESTVIAETYPAECYAWFSDEPLGSKTDKDCRKRFGAHLLLWARNSGVNVERGLESVIEAGFPDGEDDAFDAIVGLLGMLQIVLGQRTSGEPKDQLVSAVEGWILGRQVNGVALPNSSYSATTDPELRDWLRWATESGQPSNFIRAIAQAAVIADVENYAKLRGVLLRLKHDAKH